MYLISQQILRQVRTPPFRATRTPRPCRPQPLPWPPGRLRAAQPPCLPSEAPLRRRGPCWSRRTRHARRRAPLLLSSVQQHSPCGRGAPRVLCATRRPPALTSNAAEELNAGLHSTLVRLHVSRPVAHGHCWLVQLHLPRVARNVLPQGFALQTHLLEFFAQISRPS